MVMKISYFGKAVRSIIFSLQNRLPRPPLPHQNREIPVRQRAVNFAAHDEIQVQRQSKTKCNVCKRSGALTENQAVKTKIHKCLLCICRLTVCKRGKNQQSSSNRVHCSSVRRSRPIPCGKSQDICRRLYGARWWVACYNYPHREVK